MGTRLYVGNLSYNVTEPELRDVFAEGGRNVVEVKIVTLLQFVPTPVPALAVPFGTCVQWPPVLPVIPSSRRSSERARSCGVRAHVASDLGPRCNGTAHAPPCADQ